MTEAEKAVITDSDSAGNFIVKGRGETNLRSVNGASSYWALSEQGARIVTQMRMDAGNAAALAAQNQARSQAEKTISGYVDEMNRLAGQLESTMANMPGTTVDPDKPDKPDKPNKPDNPKCS